MDAHAAGDLEEVEFDAVESLAVGTGNHEDVIVVDLLLAVGQTQKRLIGLVESLLVEIDPEHVQTVLQCGAAAAGGQHDRILVDTHILGINDFITLAVFKHAILMNTARMREGVATHDSLVGLDWHIHKTAHHMARGIYLGSIDVGVDTELTMASAYHHHLLKRSIARTLADTIDGHLGLTGAVEYARHRVGRSHAEVIVAMRCDSSLVDTVDMLHKVFDLGTELARKAVTGRIGDIYDGGACLDHGLDDAGKVFVVGATGVLGIELNILDKTLGIAYTGYGTIQNILPIGVEFIADMIVRRAYACMYPLVFGILQSLGSHADIVFNGTCQSAYCRPCDGLADLYHRIEIAWTRHRETGLDHIDTKLFERARHLDFLHCVELTSGHLLTIAERRIKNKQFVAHTLILCDWFICCF